MTFNLRNLSPYYDQFRDHIGGALAFRIEYDIRPTNMIDDTFFKEYLVNTMLKHPNVEPTTFNHCSFRVHSRHYQDIVEFLNAIMATCDACFKISREHYEATSGPKFILRLKIYGEYINRSAEARSVIMFPITMAEVTGVYSSTESRNGNISSDLCWEFFTKVGERDFLYAYINNLAYDLTLARIRLEYMRITIKYNRECAEKKAAAEAAANAAEAAANAAK